MCIMELVFLKDLSFPQQRPVLWSMLLRSPPATAYCQKGSSVWKGFKRELNAFNADSFCCCCCCLNSVSRCSSLPLMIYPKPRESRRGYWPSSLLTEMPPWVEMATFLSQRQTPAYDAPVTMSMGETHGLFLFCLWLAALLGKIQETITSSTLRRWDRK